jgi:hypothetical protein
MDSISKLNIDRIDRIFWIFYFHHFPDESDETQSTLYGEGFKFSYAFTGSKVQGFKVAFSSLDWIWDAYLQEKRQLRQA